MSSSLRVSQDISQLAIPYKLYITGEIRIIDHYEYHILATLKRLGLR